MNPRAHFLAILVSLSGAIWGALSAANTCTQLLYTLTPRLEKLPPAVVISVEMQGNFVDPVTIHFPGPWAGVDHGAQVKRVAVDNESATLTLTTRDARDNHEIVTCISRDGATIRFSYEIEQHPDNPCDVHYSVIRCDLVHMVGCAIFATPELLDDHEVLWSIEWRDLHESWNTLSSFGIERKISGQSTLSAFCSALYMAGQTRLHQLALPHSAESKVSLSLVGAFDFSDQELSDIVSKIIESQRLFFDDFGQKHYCMSLVEDNLPRWGGMGLNNAFVAHIASHALFNKPYSRYRLGVVMLLAHEHLHNWISSRDSSLTTQWYTEGFTEYYSAVIGFRSNLLSLEELRAHTNQLFERYYRSSERTAPNDRIVAEFWNSSDAYSIPYGRGFTLAVLLNGLIKLNNPSESLDTPFLRHEKSKRGKKFERAFFTECFAPYVAGGIAELLARSIDAGELIDLTPIAHLLPLEHVESIDSRGNPCFLWRLKSDFTESEEEQMRKFFNVL